jgi:hypothetical protein
LSLENACSIGLRSGHLGDQPFSHRAAPMQASHVRLGPGFIDKNQSLDVNFALVPFPQLAPPCDVRTILLAGVQRFF